MAMANAPLLKVVLQEVAPVVHGLGRLDLKIHPVRQLVELAEELLELLAREQIGNLAAAYRDQEEYVPHHDGHLLEKRTQVVQVIGVVTADGGVHLDGDSRFIGPSNGLDGPCPCAGKASEGVMNRGCRSVQRNAKPNQASLLELEDGFSRQQRRSTGRKRHLHALVRSIT